MVFKVCTCEVISRYIMFQKYSINNVFDNNKDEVLKWLVYIRPHDIRPHDIHEVEYHVSIHTGTYFSFCTVLYSLCQVKVKHNILATCCFP